MLKSRRPLISTTPRCALRRATHIPDQVEAAEGMRIEAEARAERDDTSDAELDEDGAEPSASDGARLDGQPPAARRHRPTEVRHRPPTRWRSTGWLTVRPATWKTR